MVQPIQGLITEVLKMVSNEVKVGLAAIIVVLVIMVTSLVVFNSSNRMSYVTAQANRSSYTIGEDITFKLVSQNSLLGRFQSNGFSNDCGVYIFKVPDGESIDDLIANQSSYDVTTASNVPQVHFSQFNSDSGPLELKWDGTYYGYNEATGEDELQLVTAGNYLLYPKLFVTEGDYVLSKIDRSSFFHLDSLNVTVGSTYSSSSERLSIDLEISDPLGGTVGSLNSSLRHGYALDEQPYSNFTTYGLAQDYLNATIDLSNGIVWRGTLTTSRSLSEMIDFQYAGVITTERGTFGFELRGYVGSDGQVILYPYS
jgi:hypothetical protein